MKYPYIFSAMARMNWAINYDALKGLIAGVRGELTDGDRPVFHAVDEIDYAMMIADLGEGVIDREYTTIRGDVGVLHVNGPLVPRASALARSSGVVSTNMLAAEFAALDSDPAVKRIVMVYDTPGGAVVGISDFAQMIRASKTPVTAYVAGRASSGGYWLATAADEIIGADTAIVGSIGVVATVTVDKAEDTVDIVSIQSPKKRLDYATEDGRNELRSSVLNDLAAVFVRTVAENRGVDEGKVLSDFGQGGERVAAAAQAVGMIDRVATLRDVMAEFTGSGAPNGSAVAPVANNGEGNDPQVYADQTRGAKMSLKEIVNSDPEVAREVAELTAAAKAEGAAEMREIAKQVGPILTSADYPEAIKSLGVQVIEGKIDHGTFIGAVAGFDAIKATSDVQTAADETETIGETPGQDGEGVSSDDVVRTPDDYTMMIARIKQTRGIAVE